MGQALSPGPHTPVPPPPRPPAPQSRAVVVLSVALAAMVALWLIGGYLLYTYGGGLGDLPGSSPSPSAPR
jgi:hypothetical protein